MGTLHTCAATISGNAASRYDLAFCKDSNFEGTIHFSADLSMFTGSFNYSASCGSGTTTFQNMTKDTTVK